MLVPGIASGSCEPPQGVRPGAPREVRVRHELARRPCRARRDRPDPLGMVLPHETHRFCAIAVVAHHHRAVAGVQPAVTEQVHGEIDVRALLFRPNDLGAAPAPDGLRRTPLGFRRLGGEATATGRRTTRRRGSPPASRKRRGGGGRPGSAPESCDRSSPGPEGDRVDGRARVGAGQRARLPSLTRTKLFVTILARSRIFVRCCRP